MDVYRRYCRLFIEDSRKRENYEALIKYFKITGHNVSKWKTDLKKFDKQFFRKKKAKKPKAKPPTSNSGTESGVPKSFGHPTSSAKWPPSIEAILDKKCGILFDPSHSSAQVFALPKTIMVYLTQNLSIKIYGKLIETCKYFFYVKQIVPVWYLGVVNYLGEPSLFHGNSIYLHVEREISFKHKIWLGNAADFRGSLKLMDKIYQCDIKYLYITSVNMTFQEYETLVKSGNIEYISIFQTIITTPANEGIVTLERLMERLPNASKMLVNLNISSTQ